MYRHTQVGWMILGSLGAGIVFALWLAMQTGGHAESLLLLGILGSVLLLFHSLTVEVAPRAVRCWFGIGWIARAVPLDQVESARRLRNRWFYGWGIRRVPGAWMFNVGGLDAVELQLRSGGRFRIGTDDPEGLLAAIERARSLGG